MRNEKHEYLLYLSGGLLIASLFSGLCTGNLFYLLNEVNLLSAVLCLLPVCLLLLLITNYTRRPDNKICNIRITVTDILLSVYLIYTLLNTYETLDTAKILKYVSLLLLFFYFRNLKLSSTPFLLIVIIVSGVWQMIVTFKDFPLNEGMYYNAGLFACSLVVPFILITGASTYFYTTGQRNILCFTVFLLLLTTVQLVVLKSRTSWMAVIAGLIILTITVKKTQYIKICLLKKRLYGWTVAVLCLMVCTLFLFFSVKALYTFKKDSADGRLLMWTVSSSIFRQKPVIGNGTGSFGALYMDAQVAYFKEHPDSKYVMLAGDVSSPCNEYVRIAVEEGLVGLLMIIAIICFLLFGAKLKQKEKSSLEAITFNTVKAIFVALLIIALFTQAFELYPFKALGVIIVACLSSHIFPVWQMRFFANSSRFFRICLLTMLTVLFPFALYHAGAYYNSVHEWYDVKTSRIYSCNEKADLYAGLYPVLKTDAFFLYDYAHILRQKGDLSKTACLLEQAMKFRSSYSLNIEMGKVFNEQGKHQAALQCWRQASFMVPSRFLPLYLIIMLEYELGQTEMARHHAREFMRKKIKVENPEIDFMRYDILKLFNFKKL
jgi:O-antigen ligase